MTRTRTTTHFHLAGASLPPRFIARWFSDDSVEVRITSETVRAWRKAGFFGPRAQAAKGHVRVTWPELFKATGAWSPNGSFNDLQRKPYPSEIVAARLGLSHHTALDRFRRHRIPGGFKIGAYWYARASEFDAAQALTR